MIYTKDAQDIEIEYVKCVEFREKYGLRFVPFSEFKDTNQGSMFVFKDGNNLCVRHFVRISGFDNTLHLFSVNFVGHDLGNSVNAFVDFIVASLLNETCSNGWEMEVSNLIILRLRYEHTLIINGALLNYFGNKMLNAND